MRSGLYYGVDKAFETLAGGKLPQAKVGAKRKRQDNGEFVVDVYETDFGSVYPFIDHFVTSEIIASGSTLKSVAKTIADSHPVFKEWTIFSVASATKGCELLKDIEKEYGIKVNLFVNGYLGKVDDNNTDIPFYNEEAIMPEKLERILKRHYGVELYKNIICCIGDGGERLLNPEGHYKETLILYERLNLKSEKSRNKLDSILEETRVSLIKVLNK